MRRRFIFCLLALLVAVIQATMLPALFSQSWLPQILVVGTVLFASGLGMSKSWKFILLSGIFFDLLSFLPLGTTAIALLIIGYISSTLVRRLFFLQSPWGLILTTGMSIIATFMYLGLVSIFFRLGLNHNFSGAFSEVSWFLLWRSALSNALATVILYRPIASVIRRIIKKNY